LLLAAVLWSTVRIPPPLGTPGDTAVAQGATGEEAPRRTPWTLLGDLDVAGRYSIRFVRGSDGAPAWAPGLSRGFQLPRARLGLGLSWGRAATARFAVAAVRSSGEYGYIGVDGESIVAQVQLAEARTTCARAGLTVAGGLLEDPWVASADASGWERAIAPSVGEDLELWSKADLGLGVAWTSPRSFLTLEAQVTTGEGLKLRERNVWANTTLLVTLRPLALRSAAPVDLEVSLVGRDGSRGLDVVRDHRGGARVNLGAEALRGGWEGGFALGADGDAEREPWWTSLWLLGRPVRPLLAWGRLDLAAEDPTEPRDSGLAVVRLGVGAELPHRGALRPITLMVGYEGRWVGDAAAPIRGAGSLASGNTLFIQVGTHLSIAFEPGSTPTLSSSFSPKTGDSP
jgi:hypothetical protein